MAHLDFTEDGIMFYDLSKRVYMEVPLEIDIMMSWLVTGAYEPENKPESEKLLGNLMHVSVKGQGIYLPWELLVNENDNV